MNRSQYIRAAKQRAIESVKNGDIQGALNSFLEELSNYPETKNNVAIRLGKSLTSSGLLRSQEKTLRFIEGVN